MKYCILMGSPRKDGNTQAILKPFMEELTACGAQHNLFWLHDKDIQPCIACRVCQKNWEKFGCHYQDDAQEIFDDVMASDVIVLATPIYSWYCTAPMKAILDRFMYGMNKYYGETKGPSLWAGKAMALLMTCGYRPEVATELFEKGTQRYCKHSNLHYLGMHAERHLGYNTSFMDEEKDKNARAFAQKLHKQALALWI